MVKNLPAKAGDTDSIPGSERSAGKGYSYPLQYSRLGNLMNRGAWQAIVHRVRESDMKKGYDVCREYMFAHMVWNIKKVKQQ